MYQRHVTGFDQCSGDNAVQVGINMIYHLYKVSVLNYNYLHSYYDETCPFKVIIVKNICVADMQNRAKLLPAIFNTIFSFF